LRALPLPLPRPFLCLCRAGCEPSLTCVVGPQDLLLGQVVLRRRAAARVQALPSGAEQIRPATASAGISSRSLTTSWHCCHAVHTPPPPLFLSSAPPGPSPSAKLALLTAENGGRKEVHEERELRNTGGCSKVVKTLFRHSLKVRGRGRERRSAATRPAHTETNPPFSLDLPHARALATRRPLCIAQHLGPLMLRIAQRTAKRCRTMKALLVKLHCVPC